MKVLFICFSILFFISCKKEDTPKTYSINPDAVGHTWSYSTAIRHVQSGITTGNSYTFTITNNRLDFSIDGSHAVYYQLTATGDNSVKAVNESSGAVSNWTYTVNDTNRTLDLCLDSSNCYQFIR